MSAPKVVNSAPDHDVEAQKMKHDRRNSGLLSAGSSDSRYSGHGPPPSAYHTYYHHYQHHQYPHYYHQSPPPDIQTRHGALPLQSVVTTSFSAEEREAVQEPGGVARSSPENRYETEKRDVEQREAWSTRGDYHQSPPIPRPAQFSHRTYSGPSAAYYQPPLKRNFYHHSRPSDVRRPSVPSEFSPPKRTKAETPSSKHKIVTPRHFWQPDDMHAYHMSRTTSYPPVPWPYHQYLHPPASPSASPSYARPAAINLSPGKEKNQPPRWVSIAAPAPGHWVPPPQEPPAEWNQSFDSSEASTRVPKATEPEHQARAKESLSPTLHKGLVEHGVSGCEKARKIKSENGETILLLALSQDRSALSETLCIVRENIEIFTATREDVDAPAPGRKHSVSVGQVGLRCIHCRHTTKASDRVKRAVCYPSSIKRIYRTVIDMKLDHFSQCKFVPSSLQNHLNELKSVHSRSTGTTMQYFIHAAHILGMEDTESGVRFSDEEGRLIDLVTAPATPTAMPNFPSLPLLRRNSNASESSATKFQPITVNSFDSTSQSTLSVTSQDKYYNGMVSLALPEDAASLSPLRCFLREQVCAFSATEEDIAVRAPTTFSIKIGQVGIGCIHCVRQESKRRSNRAVCFPFSIGRIYQSVADIQRFHLGECKQMPTEVKEKFLQLQNASSKGSKGLATRQYWVTAAKKIGLVDTTQGLRFGRDPSISQSPKAFSLDILAQAAFNMTTASKELVKKEDKECIAEFLYVVMEQLRPCRFTEADRNKRRLKDVGCIGVECKHCAGQVDGRKFFWSSVSAVESNFVSVHTHMLECPMIPAELKNRLIELKALRKEQTSALKSGSQKAFFARVWRRLHDEDDDDATYDERLANEMMCTDEDREKSDHETAQANEENETRDGPADSEVLEVASSMKMVSV
ncbi:hypothetical protein FisN_40Lh022 [Fistulifera solaris]|uniref:Uncharacterized protein n=1 Tax=Fistulifera solaris TaxID=1519565 RepID=A0A1Z5J9I3_FISSO|nr:hypothetical protein FisN_40Lh022 [Fistulifera solaris]|eukprot:GAX10552.1 hypothetical protein FisN_40Lh022 [Fistulifera solaris]